MTEVQKRNSFLAHLWAMLCMRCPRCLQGQIFRGRFAMNDPCPVCGLIFQREEGYFLGAMYVSYGLASSLLMAGYFAGRWVLPDWNDFAVIGLLLVLYIPFVPVVFRYSRVIWIHGERWIGGNPTSDTSFEKARRQEFGQIAKEAEANPGEHTAPVPDDTRRSK